MNRYITRHRYGRYEVVDTTLDVVICYSGSLEYVNEIVQAMNKERKSCKLTHSGGITYT
jgi:hypothetical protein